MQNITRTVYTHMSTTNKSFLEMHYFLKSIGIKNNAFMLALLDPDLASIDPYDKNLNFFMKQKILRECMCNYWYFIREVVRIPDEGGNGLKYQLHRGNLALSFCMELNLNIFLELTRQQFKTVSALVRYLYEFNFGTSNSVIGFLNKDKEASKENLAKLKDIRKALPAYLRMDQDFNTDGKRIKTPDTVETLQHKTNGNRIRTFSSATSKIKAQNLIRGKTLPFLWLDEYAFIAHNSIIYTNGVPALQTAWMNAKKNNAPYGVLITTTPGFLADDEGLDAFEKKNKATEFDESWYDFSYEQIMTIVEANSASSFVYIRFTYQQLGRDEEWFANICKTMEYKWVDIRREVLLEWSYSSQNSPFTQEDLEIVGSFVKEPIKRIYFLGKYLFNIYDNLELRNGIPKYPPLIGVDVSGGYQRDSSAITCICSRTTRVVADFKNNCISTPELARVIYELVTKYMSNAIVNIERNGGYGASVLAKLIPTNIKKNLYFEIKDKVIEERNDGIKMQRRTQKTKVYGLDSTKAIRELLIQILRERMQYHKDKFISKELFNELRTLEVKRSGRVEHSDITHDDVVFSYLMAMYIWYEGKNLRETWGIEKSSILTDEDMNEVLPDIAEDTKSIITDIINSGDENLNSTISQDIKALQDNSGMLYSDWFQAELQKDNDALIQILSTQQGKEAYARQFNTPVEDLNIHQVTIPEEVFINFYNNENQ